MTNSEKKDLIKRVDGRLRTEVANLTYDPSDFFDDLTPREFAFIQKRLFISLNVGELPE